jgi:hypothetical protein
LCLLQNEVTTPSNRLEIVLDDLGKHAVGGRQGTDPNGSGTLLSLRDNIEKFSEIIQRRRQYYLIVRAGRNLEHRNPDELTDDLRINSDNMPIHKGLKNQPTVIIQNNLEIVKHYTGAIVKISLVASLENIVDAVQRSHHDVHMNNIPLGNGKSVHNFGSKGCQISFCPLSDSALWTASRHDFAKITNKICQK